MPVKLRSNSPRPKNNSSGDDVLDNYAHKLLEDERSSNDIETRALEDKLFAAIKDAVTLDEKSVSVDEFNKLFEK